jgi:hypothetical protein
MPSTPPAGARRVLDLERPARRGLQRGLRSTMRALRGDFKDAGQNRCANLALDMQMAASYVLPSASWRDRAEKVLWSP